MKKKKKKIKMMIYLIMIQVILNIKQEINYFLQIMAQDINVIVQKQDVINFIVNVIIKVDIAMNVIVKIVKIKNRIIFQVISAQKNKMIKKNKKH